VNSTVEIDEVDAKIIRALIKNARTRLTVIAKDCGLSSAAISNRIKRLRATRVITGTVLFSNLSLLGYVFPATIEVNLPPTKEVPLINSTKKQENVNLIFYDIGGNSLLLFVVGKSLMDIDNLKHELKNQLGNRRIAVSLWGTPTFSFDSIAIEPTRAEHNG
jgi:Lrp/AsnC family transcriptional regulator for asnA, asnC and gidA